MPDDQMFTPADTDDRCPACGHVHAGPELAGICIGCPCLERAA